MGWGMIRSDHPRARHAAPPRPSPSHPVVPVRRSRARARGAAGGAAARRRRRDAERAPRRRGGGGHGTGLMGGGRVAVKTRLVRELAHEAASEGALVLYGACDAVVRPPYAPVVTALEHLERVTDPEVLRADLGTTGGELTRLVPALGVRVGGLPEPMSGDAEFERHRLHTAVSELLANASARHPLLLVLEDIHWADPSTLLVLCHLARATTAARMLVLATFRDTPSELTEEASNALVALRRVEGVARLRLAGLSDDEVAEFVHRAAGVDRDTGLNELARAIADVSDGNPLLLAESWRAVADAGALERGSVGDLTAPESLRGIASERWPR